MLTYSIIQLFSGLRVDSNLHFISRVAHFTSKPLLSKGYFAKTKLISKLYNCTFKLYLLWLIVPYSSPATFDAKGDSIGLPDERQTFLLYYDPLQRQPLTCSLN